MISWMIRISWVSFVGWKGGGEGEGAMITGARGGMVDS